MKLAFIASAGLLAFAALAGTSGEIRPGEVWRDTAGAVIQAHGGGILKVGRAWYWFGEDRALGAHFAGVSCYRSTDLVHWEPRGHALSPTATTPGGDLDTRRVVERPKVLYNRPTRTFVMYLHIDSPNYAEAKVGVATSRGVEGPYEYRGSFRPLGHQSRDMTVYEDTDGTAYLVFEDRESGVRVARLAPDYLTVEQPVALIPHAYEALAVIKHGPTYFLLGSHLSGWDLNANQYSTASSLAGPWSDFHDVAPPETKTYQSQTAFILPVHTRSGERYIDYIYIGDRWNPRDLADSRYVWLPLDVHDTSMWLPADAPWSPAALGVR